MPDSYRLGLYTHSTTKLAANTTVLLDSMHCTTETHFDTSAVRPASNTMTLNPHPNSLPPI